jgi:hypothetical protein
MTGAYTFNSVGRDADLVVILWMRIMKLCFAWLLKVSVEAVEKVSQK